MKVIQLLASGRMDQKKAGLILYALQTASINLRRTDFEARDPTNVVIDRNTVAGTCIDGQQWFEEDFGDGSGEDEESGDENAEEGEDEEDGEENDEEDEVEETDDDDSTVVARVEPVPGRKKPPQVKEITAEEARMQVRGVVQDWLSRKGKQETAAKPG
jgi:hypothetical protein